jgi:N-methylhydantoinase A
MAKLVGIDVGGTFTDAVYIDDTAGEIKIAKASTTPEMQSKGVMKALGFLGQPLESIDLFVHGCTTATNAVIERKGSRCGLIATKGFRDVLELGRRDRPYQYGLMGTQNPLIPRELRFEVEERLLWDGTVREELNENQVLAIGQQLKSLGAECIVVSFLHSYINPVHERRTKELLQSIGGFDVVISSDVMREFYEFERTSTASVAGYIKPVMRRYIENLEKELRENGYRGALLFMQGNGGVTGPEVVKERPSGQILSGPAAGVIAASFISGRAGFRNAISADMGGTSFDVCLIVNGQPRITEETMIDYRIPLKQPMVEIQSIGAGGGSIAWIDRAGLLQVGPQSAGARPGPVCYGQGNTEPTVTDANLVLGRIDPSSVIGGGREISLDREMAEKAIVEKIASPLSLGKEEAAMAILRVVNSNMVGRIRTLSIEKGYDPRKFALIAFGGSGPLHAVAIARGVGISKVLIPLYPGVFSAFGCVISDIRHDFAQTLNKVVDDLRDGELETTIQQLTSSGYELLNQEKVSFSNITVIIEADMAYEGQRHTVKVPVPSDDLTVSKIKKCFESAYEQAYGQLLPQMPIRLVTLRTAVIGVRPKPGLSQLGRKGTLAEAIKGERRVLFDGDWLKTPVYHRPLLPSGCSIEGPAVIEQEDATAVLEPNSTGIVDEIGNLIVAVAK